MLQDLNPSIIIELLELKISSDDIDYSLKDFDIIVEGGMSPAGRNLINEYCLKNKKPMVHASAQFTYGYVFSVLPEFKTACIFPDDHTRTTHISAVPVNALSTSVARFLGAAEVLKYLLGYKENMVVNRKHFFNSLILSGEFESEIIPRNKFCPVCMKYYD